VGKGADEEFDWDGNLVWAIDYYSPTYIHHHDFKVLPNGNVLLLVAEKKTYAEVIAAGFDPSLLDPASAPRLHASGLSGRSHAHAPLRRHGRMGMAPLGSHDSGLRPHQEQLRGRVRSSRTNSCERVQQQNPQFWNHVNGIDYHAGFDQVMLSIRGNSELFVIDHQSTTAQAASHSGGRYNKGGDILYRWGTRSNTTVAHAQIKCSFSSTIPTGSRRIALVRATSSSSTTALARLFEYR